MATLTRQTIDIDGLIPTLQAADAGGDDFAAGNRRTILMVRNASAGSVDVTVTSYAATPVGTSQTDHVVSVGAGDDALIGPFPSGLRDDEQAVSVGYSDATDVEVAALELD